MIVKIKLIEFRLLLTLLYLLAQQQCSQELILRALIVDGLDEFTALLEHLHLAILL